MVVFLRRVAVGLSVGLVFTSCSVDTGGGDDAVATSEVTLVDLDLPVPTYAVATRQGLVVRAGDTERVFRDVSTVEWLPGGRALLYYPTVARIWDPATDTLGPQTRFTREGVIPGEIKRSVTQVNVTLDPGYGDPDTTRLAAYTLDLDRKWRIVLPGPDNDDPDAGTGSGFVRGYLQGHTIDGVTYLNWEDYDPNGEESERHYGLLRVGPDGEVLDQVQVNQRITSTWLSADGASLLALRRPSGDPCGGCVVELELVDLDPATGEVAAEYGMPEGYEAGWRVTEVDKVGDRVAVRFEETFYPNDPDALANHVLRGTWIRDDDGWTLLEGSEDEISWWQGPEDRIVARPDDDPATNVFEMDLVRVHGDEEEPVGALVGNYGHRYYEGSIPGQALPPQ